MSGSANMVNFMAPWLGLWFTARGYLTEPCPSKEGWLSADSSRVLLWNPQSLCCDSEWWCLSQTDGPVDLLWYLEMNAPLLKSVTDTSGTDECGGCKFGGEAGASLELRSWRPARETGCGAFVWPRPMAASTSRPQAILPPRAPKQLELYRCLPSRCPANFLIVLIF